jgi:hypothetical protein
MRKKSCPQRDGETRHAENDDDKDSCAQFQEDGALAMDGGCQSSQANDALPFPCGGDLEQIQFN